MLSQSSGEHRTNMRNLICLVETFPTRSPKPVWMDGALLGPYNVHMMLFAAWAAQVLITRLSKLFNTLLHLRCNDSYME